MYACVFVCVLAVYNKVQAQRILTREFKLWTFLQGSESRVATFLAEICVMSHQSLCVCVCARARARVAGRISMCVNHPFHISHVSQSGV